MSAVTASAARVLTHSITFNMTDDAPLVQTPGEFRRCVFATGCREKHEFDPGAV
jgi:hypothetical protein